MPKPDADAQVHIDVNPDFKNNIVEMSIDLTPDKGSGKSPFDAVIHLTTSDAADLIVLLGDSLKALQRPQRLRD